MESESATERFKEKEIKHGRLAMVAMLGLFAQAAATRDGPYQNLLDVSLLHSVCLCYSWLRVGCRLSVIVIVIVIVAASDWLGYMTGFALLDRLLHQL